MTRAIDKDRKDDSSSRSTTGGDAPLPDWLLVGMFVQRQWSLPQLKGTICVALRCIAACEPRLMLPRETCARPQSP